MIITNVWNGTPASSLGALSGNFTTNGAYVQIFFAGSAWHTPGPGMVGVNLLIDGNFVTSAKVYTNEQASHKCLIPVSVVMKLPAGLHAATIAAADTQTKIDHNDLFTLIVTELLFH